MSTVLQFGTLTAMRSVIVGAPLVVSADTSVRDVIAKMSELQSRSHTAQGHSDVDECHRRIRAGCAIVVEKNKIVGIFTEQDVVRLSALDHCLKDRAIRAVMLQPVITLPESALTDVVAAAALLHRHQIRYLPIVDEQDCLVGLVTHESLQYAYQSAAVLQAAAEGEKSLVGTQAQGSKFIDDHKAAKEQLQSLIAGTAATTGEDFFPLKTQHKNTQVELAQSEAKFRRLIEGMRDLVWSSDAHGRFSYLSPQFQTLFGWNPAEWIGQPFMNIIHAEDLPIVTVNYQAVLQLSQDSCDCEFRIRHRDGYFCWVRISAKPMFSDLGQIIGTQGTLSDIGDRKKIEQDLQQSQQFLHTVLNTFPQSVFWKDRNSIYLGCNETFLRDAGLTSIDEIIGKSDLDLPWADSEADFYRADDQAVISSKVPKLGVVETQVRADGEKVWIETNKLPLLDTTGQVVGVLGTYQDISSRRRAELKMQQQTRQKQLLWNITQIIRQSLNFEVIVNTTVNEVRQILQVDRVAVYRVEPDWSGEFIAESVADGWRKLVGVKHDRRWVDTHFQATSEGLLQLDEAISISDIYQSGLQPGHVELLESYHIRAYALSPITYAGKLWGLIALYQNDWPHQWTARELELLQQVTSQLGVAIQQADLLHQLQQELGERTQAQQLLTQRNEELARATRLKDEFLANMSHELRTPLNAILGMTEGLTEQVFGNVNNRQLKALATIERSGSHLLELINDILDVAKIESGQIELDCVSISPMLICESSLAFIKQQAHRKRITISTNIPPNLPNLMVDERRIRQVAINLLNNAVKFTPEGGCITLGIEQTQQGFLRISITDTGIGISSENIKKLFQPFVQIDSALNRQYDGTGLGLALVKQIVELHGGCVGLTSEVGVGSCFSIELPCVDLDCNPLPSTPSPMADVSVGDTLQPVPVPRLVAPLILLAEDNSANVSTIVSYLTAKGYRLLVAGNGQEAIDLVQSARPDLVLMDIQMPGMDGLEAMQEIRRDPQFANLPMIALTALAMADDRERCIAAGANDYMSKPIKLKNLAQTVQAMLVEQSAHLLN